MELNNFDFSTKTEKALDKVGQTAFEEGLIDDLSKDYNYKDEWQWILNDYISKDKRNIISIKFRSF